jgi:general secretion pathway protein F
MTLAGLLRSGVGLLPSLAIVRALVDNVLVAEVLDTAMARITAGDSLAESLADSPWFPPALRRMIGVGERSGSLEKMLEKSAAVYEGEAEASLTALTALLEPLMIVVMGVAVGFVVLSILLPIFEMSQMIG